MGEGDYLAQLKGREVLWGWELHAIVCKFNEMGIPIMLIKSAIDLAFPENRSPLTPPQYMGDIDLLIHEDDWDNAVLGLNDLGYLPSPLNKDENFDLSEKGQAGFLKSEPYVFVDLHYNITKWQRSKELILVDELWTRYEQIEFDDALAFIPSYSDQLWIQFVHLFIFHSYSLEEMIGNYGKLWCLIDMSIWHYDKIDWDEIIKKAQHHEVELLLYLLWCGIEFKYNRKPPFPLDEQKNNHAHEIWEWMIWSKRIPLYLNYAIGRFNTFAIFLNCSFCKTFRIFYNEIKKTVSRDMLYKKYHLPHIGFLYPIVMILHLLRSMSLHLVIGVYHFRFRCRKKIKQFIINSETE
jgi:hypothetical protein